MGGKRGENNPAFTRVGAPVLLGSGEPVPAVTLAANVDRLGLHAEIEATVPPLLAAATDRPRTRRRPLQRELRGAPDQEDISVSRCGRRTRSCATRPQTSPAKSSHNDVSQTQPIAHPNVSLIGRWGAAIGVAGERAPFNAGE
jgi:hypothetical protein